MHKVLLKTTRSGYLDTIFFGSVYHSNRKKLLLSYGENEDNICFLRSVAKPVQSSILFDYDLVKKYDIKDYELAIFSGSHSGTNKHINVLKNVLRKNNLKISDLSIEPIEPLDKKDYKGRPCKLHNNCSGKHTMMLLCCKHFGFDYNYTNANHPLQKIIKQKQEKLSGYKSDILTYDGCSTPLWGLPYKAVLKMYFNLIDEHRELIEAIMKNPYIYGGANRLDSKIIKLGRGNLFSKVGAGGLVIIYNFKEDEILFIKMAQDNEEARELVALDYLDKLNWLKYKIDENLYNQKKQIVAKYEFALR